MHNVPPRVSSERWAFSRRGQAKLDLQPIVSPDRFQDASAKSGDKSLYSEVSISMRAKLDAWAKHATRQDPAGTGGYCEEAFSFFEVMTQG